MENKHPYNLQSENTAYDSPLPSSIDDLRPLSPESINSTALDTTTLEDSSSKGWGAKWHHLSWPVMLSAAAAILIAGGALWMYAVRSNDGQPNSQEVASKYGELQIPLSDLLTGKDLSLSGASNVTINGALNLGQDLLLTPSLQPTGAKAGQIYYDQGTNELAYYNGENFVFLTGPDLAAGGVQSLGGAVGEVTLGSGLSSTGGRLDNSGVLTVQGQSGNITLTAGPGLVINGTRFSNTGVLGITSGSSNVSVTRDNNGSVSISVDQPIAGTGTVTSSGGNAGTIPLFTTSQNIEDSIITQAGLAVSIAGSLQLSNALTVPNGGTGRTSLTGNGVLVGQGIGAITSVAAGGTGLCLLSTAGAPVWGVCPGGGGSGVSSLNSLTGGLSIANASATGSTITIDDATTSAKGIASFNSTNFSVTGGAVNTAQNINSGATPTFAGVNTNSITPAGPLTVGISAQTALLQGSTTTITSNGAGNNIVLNSAATIELQDNTNITGSLTTTGDVAVNGGDITSTGALNITPGGALTVGIGSQVLTLQGGATSSFRATSGANTTTVAFASPSASTTLNFPALAAGTYTICTTSGNCSGAAATLQSTYDNSSTPEIVLDATRAALTIRDNASAIGGNLLEVQNNAGSTTYFAVTASGVAVAGSASVTGNVNATGGALQTNGTNRIDNTGNALNLGNITLSGTISGGTTITGSGNINTTSGAIQTNGTSRIDTSGNLINIAAITASGSATFQGGAATLGTNAQAGTIVLNDGSSNTGTLQVAALGQNTVYTLPDPGAGTATICLTTGNCAGSGSGVTTSGGTTNRLPKFTGSQSLGNSTISDDGTNVTISVDVIIQGGDLTVGTASQAASVVMHDGNGQTTTLQAGNSTGDITFILPTSTGSANQCLKQSGTGNQLIWQDCDGGSGGSSATLQSAYANSSDPEIVLSSSVGGFTIRDSSTPLGANLFEIQNNLGNTTYLAVTVSGLSVTGAATATGNVNSSGGSLQTNGTSRVDNSGNLVNIGNITGSGAVTIASTGAGNDITVNGADQFIVQDTSVFNALSTFNANIDLGTNDIVGTTADIDLTNFDVTGATGNVTAGTYNGQTISSSANFTGTVAVAGNTTLTGDVAVNGGDITSTGALNITPGGALTVGISAQTALLQGSTTTITSNGAGNDIVLNSADTIELQDNTNVTGNLAASGDIAVNGGDLTSTGALNITPGGTLTVGASTQTLTLQGGATTSFRATSGADTTTVAFTSPTANTTLNFPALAAGTYTICTTSGNCAGSATTLQSAYDNGSTPEIVLDATRLGLTIRDNASAVGGNLLEVQNNAGSTTYLAVTSLGAAITGTATVTGNVNSTGGSVQTNNTNRIDNSGNLVNIGNITGSGAMTIASAGAGNDITINGADQFIVQDSSVFNALTTFNANIDMGTNDIVGTTADIDLTNFDVVGSTGSVTAGTYNGQTISSSANFTGSLTTVGNINTTGGALQTNSTTRVDNSGNLTNIGNITGTGAITIASSGAGNDVIINGADQFIVQDVAQFNAQANFDLGGNGEVYITGTGSAANTRDYLIVDMVNNSTSGTQRGMLIQNAAGTGSTEGFIALDNVDTDTSVGYGIQITSSVAGITTALDVSDADIVTALSFGANDLVGTTGNIDMTNFDVAGSTGNVTAGTYNGQTISSAASFTGTVTAATALRAPSIDTATAVALALGTTNATAINLNQNTVVQSGKTLTVAGGATSLVGATSGDALTVSNSTSTGYIAVFRDNATEVFTIADSGLITAKSQGTSTAAFDIQNSFSQSLFAADTFNNTVHLRTIGRDNTSTFESIWLQGGKNANTAFIGGNDDTSGYVANDFSGSLRFNGSNVGWGDMAFFPQGGGNGNNGHFRFSTTGSALNTTPNAKLGVGDLYVAGNAGIGTNSPSYKLHVAGDVNVNSGSVYRIAGTTVCSGTTCTPASGSGNYIQNQSASQQSSSSFWVSGSGRVDGGVLTNGVTSNSGALVLQAATNVISLGGSDSLTANGGFNIFTGTNSSLSVNANGTGTLSLGSNAASGRIINIGATGTQANTSTTNIGTSSGAAQTINIGSGASTGATTIVSGTGNLNLQSNGATIVKSLTDGAGAFRVTDNSDYSILSVNTTTNVVTTDGLQVNGTFEGGGLTDCDSSNAKLLYDATTKQFICGTDRASATVRKTLDEARTSSTTLTGTGLDDQLTFAVDANSTYVFEINLNVTLANAPNNGGFKYDIGSVPSGATCNYSSHGMDSSGGAAEVINGSCTTTGTYLNSEGSYFVQLSGTVVTSAAGGSVTLRWAQNTSDTDATTVKAGSSLTAFKVNGADLAEAYYSKDMSIGPGDLIQLDDSIKAGVKKADKPYNSRTMGIVTTQPGLVMGDDTVSEGKPVLLALSGRVPVKVSTENGPIEPGDFLTSSSTPGVAMKATKSGYAIAQAMTGFSGDGTGTVLAFIKNGWYQPPQVTGTDLQNSTLDGGTISSLRIEGPLTVTGDALFQGKIAVKDIEITGHITVSGDTAGTAVIPAGQTFVDVTFKAPYASAPKVTATASGFVPIEITGKTVDGFRIHIPEAKAVDTSIDWISLQLAE